VRFWNAKHWDQITLRWFAACTATPGSTNALAPKTLLAPSIAAQRRRTNDRSTATRACHASHCRELWPGQGYKVVRRRYHCKSSAPVRLRHAAKKAMLIVYMSDGNNLVRAGFRKFRTIEPQGFWPDLRGGNRCGSMVLISYMNLCVVDFHCFLCVFLVCPIFSCIFSVAHLLLFTLADGSQGRRDGTWGLGGGRSPPPRKPKSV